MRKSFWRGFKEVLFICLNLFFTGFWILAAILYELNPEKISHETFICSFLICAVFFFKLVINDIADIMKK